MGDVILETLRSKLTMIEDMTREFIEVHDKYTKTLRAAEYLKSMCGEDKRVFNILMDEVECLSLDLLNIKNSMEELSNALHVSANS